MTTYGGDTVELQGRGGQVDTVPSAQTGDVAITRQGALIAQDQILEWTLQGKTFHAQIGDAVTLVDFVETAYDEDQPQFALRVPAGATVIPFSLSAEFQDMAGTNTHVIWSMCNNDIGNGTSTAATISAMRSDAPVATLCTARSLYTANATAATAPKEIIRWVDAFADVNTFVPAHFKWDLMSSGVVPVLVGPATLFMHAVSTTDGPEGFAEVAWVEFVTSTVVKT